MPKNTFKNLPLKKKEAVLNAAIKVIIEKGYDKTTISDIVNEAAIARGSFYQYFNDKLDLYYYLLDSVQAKKFTYFKPLMTKLDQVSFLDLYEEFVIAGVKFAKKHHNYFMLGYRLHFASDKTIQKLMQKIETEGIKTYESFLINDQNKGFIKPTVDIQLVAKILYHFNVVELSKHIYNHESLSRIRMLANDTITILKYGVMVGEEKK